MSDEKDEDEIMESSEDVQDLKDEKRTREQTMIVISDTVSKWKFLSDQVMGAVGGNEAAQTLAKRMLGAALVESLAGIVAEELEIDFIPMEIPKDS